VIRAVALVAVLIILGSVALQDTNAVTGALRAGVERAGQVCALSCSESHWSGGS
jgi:hypothetical protein